jgi:uncharacterized membrane protein YgaE (UPF0421/DUF939 family)
MLSDEVFHRTRKWRQTIVAVGLGVSQRGIVTRNQVILALKAAIAAGIAWIAALSVDPHNLPYFAPIAVLLVVQPTIYDSVARALQRVLGVTLGVAVAIGVSHFLTPSAWSIGIIIFLGLLLGLATRLGPQVPISALLVLLIGRLTPGYGGERIVDTLIGAGIAVLTVLVSPPAPTAASAVSGAVAPIHRCGDLLRVIASGVASHWTAERAGGWCQDALSLVDATAKASKDYESHRLNDRWNARAYRARPLLEQTERAIRTGERIAIHTRSIARALVDGSADARPMPALGTMLCCTASATDAYGAWATSTDSPTDRRRLSERLRAVDETLSGTLALAQERWGNDPTQWLTFVTVLAMSQRILAEVGHSLNSKESELL